MASAAIHDFFESSTIHGLAHISSEKSKIAKAIWLAIVLACFAIAIYMINRACCREIKNPNQYGGVILWCLFMYRIDP